LRGQWAVLEWEKTFLQGEKFFEKINFFSKQIEGQPYKFLPDKQETDVIGQRIAAGVTAIQL
jgi:hypothetical protein